jgi:hypothetical protein
MKKLVQIAVGAGVILGLAPFTYGTPLHTGMIYVPLFLGAMYGTAVVQHYWPLWSNRRRRC